MALFSGILLAKLRGQKRAQTRTYRWTILESCDGRAARGYEQPSHDKWGKLKPEEEIVQEDYFTNLPGERLVVSTSR